MLLRIIETGKHEPVTASSQVERTTNDDSLTPQKLLVRPNPTSCTGKSTLNQIFDLNAHHDAAFELWTESFGKKAETSQLQDFTLE